MTATGDSNGPIVSALGLAALASGAMLVYSKRRSGLEGSEGLDGAE